MKKMTRTLASLLALGLFLTGCGAQETKPAESSKPAAAAEASKPAESKAAESKPEESKKPEAAAPMDINIAALKGPTALGLVDFMSKVEAGEIKDNNYKFTIATKIDEVLPKLVKGELQFASIPANVASVIYNNSKGKVRVVALNTLGVLSICETGDSIKSIADLKGKTIYAPGKGATPEYVLNYLLAENGLKVGTDVQIEWKSEPTEVVAAVSKDPNAVCMLPQPFVTVAMQKNPKLRIALDLTKEWDKLQEGKSPASALVTGVVVARADMLEKHPQQVAEYLKHYQASIEATKDAKKTGELSAKYDIVKPAAIAEKAIPGCNMVFITGQKMKDMLSGYLKVLFDQNPKAVGGKLPGDDFYALDALK